MFFLKIILDLFFLVSKTFKEAAWKDFSYSLVIWLTKFTVDIWQS